MSNALTDWDLPEPFIHTLTVAEADIDAFGHANNASYLKWADATAWAHWQSDGLAPDDCRKADQGMAIVHSQADYSGHVKAGESLHCAVWIAHSDAKLRAQRWYQFRRAHSGETVFRARTHLVCFKLSTGKPTRMSAMFAQHYARPSPILAKAVDDLTES